jgi:ribosomal protein S19
MSAAIDLTTLCCGNSLYLTYGKVQQAINNCHDRQKLERLRHESRGLEVTNPDFVSCLVGIHQYQHCKVEIQHNIISLDEYSTNLV